MNENLKSWLFLGLGVFLLMFTAQLTALWLVQGKANNASKFNLSEERIAKDLDGKAVPLMMNQVWPFDASQNINVIVKGKRPLEEFVSVLVEVKALAPVQQEVQPVGPLKEHSAINPEAKDAPKILPTPVKLPSKIALNGRMKLTYEFFEGEWYLINVENLTLKATPID